MFRAKSFLNVLMYIFVWCTTAGALLDVDLGTFSSSQGFTLASGGSSVSAAGDMNGDGVGDVIIGSYWANGFDGMAYVVFGKRNTGFANMNLATFTTGITTGFRILAATLVESNGWSVSKAGDVNSDGVDDVIIGARYADPSAGKPNAGISYVIFGRRVTSAANAFTDIQLLTTALPASVGFRILGAVLNDNSGWSVSNAGDMNDDGIDDVIVGSVLADPPLLAAESNAGISYVVFGRNMTGSVAAFGDVNLVNVISGSTLGFRILGAAVADLSGYAVSGVGDVNGDGISDVAIGARVADTSALPAGADAGIAYVIFGRSQAAQVYNSFEDISLSAAPLPSDVGFRVLGPSASAQVGYAISGADVNGDGISDLLVGAPYADPPGLIASSDAGITYVIYGYNIGGGAAPFADIDTATISTGSTIGFRILGAAVGDSSGGAVASAGDVNGDGVDDIIVGARGADPTVAKSSAGISYVVFGKKSVGGAAVFGDINLALMTATSQFGYRILGTVSNENTGHCVSGTGDLNGDGFGDVIVGTPLGASYVLYGFPATPTSQPSSQPSRQPSRQPSGQPTRQPTSQPSRQPSRQPTSQPSRQPSKQPSTQPTHQPSSQPTRQPTTQPTRQPSMQPTARPTGQPSVEPSRQPTGQPSKQPSRQPTQQPTVQPSRQPTGQPSCQPSAQPTQQPSAQPSVQPSRQPSTQPSRQPLVQPSHSPSRQPTNQPSAQPSCIPTVQSSGQPSGQPSSDPTLQPSSQPSIQPTQQPFSSPSALPSGQPSYQPSAQPSLQPSTQPSSQPSTSPTGRPSGQPSSAPTAQSTNCPTMQPSLQPTSVPTLQPSELPSTQPSNQPSAQPSGKPTQQPLEQPSSQPSSVPTAQPSRPPSSVPSSQPTAFPSSQPTIVPSGQPSVQPSTAPSRAPSCTPSVQPTAQPSSQVTVLPSIQPSGQPSSQPSLQPSEQPSAMPTSLPTAIPTLPLIVDPNTATWFTNVPTVQRFNDVALVAADLWACGVRNNTASCTVLKVNNGAIQMEYDFPLSEIVSVMQTDDSNRVTLSARTSTQFATATSDLANCKIEDTQLTCAVKSFYDTYVTAVTYVPFPKKVLYIGAYNAFVSASIVDVATGTLKSYFYTSSMTKSFVITHAESPPSFLGSFVAGTGISASGAMNYIIAGMVRTDSGIMTAMYLTPTGSNILNSAELVNAMTQEYVNPDSFIAGGLQLSDGTGIHAYAVCQRALWFR